MLVIEKPLARQRFTDDKQITGALQLIFHIITGFPQVASVKWDAYSLMSCAHLVVPATDHDVHDRKPIHVKHLFHLTNKLLAARGGKTPLLSSQIVDRLSATPVHRFP